MQLSKVTYTLPRFAEYDLKVTMPLYGQLYTPKMDAYMPVATTSVALVPEETLIVASWGNNQDHSISTANKR